MVDREIHMTELGKTWVSGELIFYLLFQSLRRQHRQFFSNPESRCRRKPEDLGDSAVNVKTYDGAVSQYTAALSPDPAVPTG